MSGQVDTPAAAAPQAGGVDYVLGADGAFVGDHVPAAVGALLQVLHHREAVDLGAGHAGGDGIGVGDAIGIDVAAVGTMQGSYTMTTAEGTTFDAEIAPFTLAMPNALN